MRKLITLAVLASTGALAAPAAAQYHDPYRGGDYGRYDEYGRYDQGYGYGQTRQVEQRLYRLRERIGRLSQRGAVSRSESYRLQRELYNIERRYADYARNGLSQRELYDIQVRIERLQQQIREDRRDGRRYDDRRYDDYYRY